jgi:hypothetical protein
MQVYSKCKTAVKPQRATVQQMLQEGATHNAVQVLNAGVVQSLSAPFALAPKVCPAN